MKNRQNADSSSSCEERSTSDEDSLSDFIKNHRIPLPQLNVVDIASTQQYSEGVFESAINNGHSGMNNNEDDNWELKKRRSDTSSPDITPTASVGMLVPSPIEEVKTLIGDQTTDEVSDLSEFSSDGESDIDSDADDSIKTVPHVLVESKTLIGGKNEVESFFDQTPISQADSLTSEPFFEARNEDVVMDVGSQKTSSRSTPIVEVKSFDELLLATSDDDVQNENVVAATAIIGREKIVPVTLISQVESHTSKTFFNTRKDDELMDGSSTQTTPIVEVKSFDELLLTTSDDDLQSDNDVTAVPHAEPSRVIPVPLPR